MERDRVVLWLLRLLWLSLPAALGGLLADALDGPSRPVRLVLVVLSWAAWATGLVAVLVPSTVSLTVLRLVAPAAGVAAVAAALAADRPSGLVLVGGLATGLGGALVAFTPEVGAVAVQGSAYGAERRLPLRVPGLLLLGVLPLVWVLFAGALLAGPLLLAARQWVLGAVLVAGGGPVVVLIARAVHQLSRRWLVLVPAGLVVHDQLVLAETLLLRTSEIDSFGPAPADTDATDLTQGALGLALELRLRQPVSVALRVGRQAELRTTDAILVTPTRPGRTLEAARAHRIRGLEPLA